MGRPGWLATIESCRRITIKDISTDNMLRDRWEWNSRILWPDGFAVDAQCRIEPPHWRKLTLKYRWHEFDDELEDIEEAIYLQRYPQPFGGHRWYFICPSTNRRCQILCLPPGSRRFRSRWGFRRRLQYQSQRLAPQFRYQHGASQAAKCVLRKGTRQFQEEYADWEFPPKPKWMRWKTYNRLDEKAQGYEQAADAEMAWRLRRYLLPGETVTDMAERMFPGSTPNGGENG